MRRMVLAALISVSAIGTALFMKSSDAADPSSQPECRDSVESRCGPPRWDRDSLPNEPMSITLAAPTSAHAGETIEFRVHAEDDASVEPELNRFVDYGDGTAEPGKAFSMACRSRHGTWTTPSKRPNAVDAAFQHSYDRPGRYTVTISYFSWTKSICDIENDPFADVGVSTVTVEVTP